MKTILEAYHQRIETGQLTYDLAQEEAAYILNEFQSYLEQQADKRKHKIARENPFTWLSGCFSWLSLFFVASIQPKPSMKQAEKKAGKGRIEKTKRPFVLPGAYKGIYLYGPVGGGKVC